MNFPDEPEFVGTLDRSFDRLDAQGIFTAGGTLNLQLIDGFVPVAGNSFLIFNGPTPGFDVGSFTFTTNLGGRLFWDTSALASSGIVSVIPKTETVGLVTLRLGSLVLLRRQR